MSITKQKPRQSRKAILHHKTKPFLAAKIKEYLKQFGETSSERKAAHKAYLLQFGKNVKERNEWKDAPGDALLLHYDTLYKVVRGESVQVKSLLAIFDFFKIEWVLVNGKYQHIENEK